MEIIVTPPAQKQYNRLPTSEQRKIDKKFSSLELFPDEGKKLSGELASLRSVRAWPYRILYLIDLKRRKIFVVTIAHRQGVYK